MRLRGRSALLAALIMGTLSCAPAHRPRAAAVPAAPRVDWAAKIREADCLYAAGHYVALARALEIYASALAEPEWKSAAVEKAVRAALAVGLREKDLGIPEEGTSRRLGEFLASDISLSFYEPYAELLEVLPSRIKGIAGDNLPAGWNLDQYFDWITKNAAPLDEALKERAESDDLMACLRIELRQAFPFKFRDKFVPAEYAAKHPGSRLVAFACAVFPAPNRESLDALLDLDRDFAEAHYYLGEMALAEGLLVTAENHYLQACEKIPGSPSILISLAGIAFQMEELEACLDDDEKALAFVPSYRDALLGKAMCLGYLGRHGEALETLQRMLELGTYYMGEAHYWTAWNLNELGRLDEARLSIDSAKTFLAGQPDVLTLSGIIGYEQGRLDAAEKDFREALGIQSADCDAAYYLGKIYADRRNWRDSGAYFMGASSCFEKRGDELEKKIREIEGSPLGAGRKERLIRNKRRQILENQAVKATCQYNGAAGFYNAGSLELALPLAELAVAHPAFAEKAGDLVRLIKGKMR
jgi:tetratricopeptide (TPR) repeat protein